MTPKKFVFGTQMIVGIIVFLVLFSFSPTMYEWNARGRVHDDRFFELVHNFPTDYNLYLSKIRQGKEGAWVAKEKYTSEPHSGSLSQIFYIFIGRLAHFSYVQTPYVWFAYHVSRLFFAGLLLWCIWKVSEWVMREGGWGYALLLFLLIALQSTWPKFEVVLGVPRLGGWMPWYTQADSLQRTTFMPHVLIAQSLMIFIFWVFSSLDPKTRGFITRKHPGNAVFLGVVGLFLGIIFPPGLTFVYGVLAAVTFGEFLNIWWKRGLGGRGMTPSIMKSWFSSLVFDRIVFGSLSAPSLVYFMLLLSEYPWKRLVEFDVLHPTKFSFVEYFMAVGPLLPIGVLGILLMVVWKKWDILEKLKYFFWWIVMWLGFLFLFNYIPQQSPTRFTQMVPQVPLGVFTGVMIFEIMRRLRLSLSQSRQLSAEKRSFFAFLRVLVISIPVVIIFFAFASMASSFMWLRDFVDHKLRATIPLVPHNAEVMYPMREIVEGLVWLQVHTPRDAIVITGMTTGNYMPVYSGNTAFIGHANTVHMEEKSAAVANFYRKHLTEEEEMAFLKDTNASYVFYGPEEKEMSGWVEDLKTLYPELTEVYQSPMVRIYKTP